LLEDPVAAAAAEQKKNAVRFEQQFFSARCCSFLQPPLNGFGRKDQGVKASYLLLMIKPTS